MPAFASTTAPPIVVMGSDNVAKTMAYTAFNNNGQVEKNPDFEITQNNVVSIVANGKLTLLSTNGLAFSNAQITDANQKTTDVHIVNNQVTFTTPGVFTFTVVSGQYAYTCIVVVGEQPKQNIDKQISNTYVIIDIIIEDREIPCDDDPKLKECVPPVDCKKTPEDPKCKPTPPPPTCPVLEKDGKTCSPLPDPGGVTPPPSPKPDPLYGGDSFFNGPSPEPAPEEGDTENGEDSTDGESAEDGGSSDEGSSEEGDDGGNSVGETGGDSFFG